MLCKKPAYLHTSGISLRQRYIKLSVGNGQTDLSAYTRKLETFKYWDSYEGKELQFTQKPVGICGNHELENELCDNDNCCLFDNPPCKFRAQNDTEERTKRAA